MYNVSKLKSLLQLLPTKEPVSLCFAYGSAIFQQGLDATTPTEAGPATSRRKMIDLVVAVDNPFRWHQANLTKNPDHYSFLRWLGAAKIAQVQQQYGAKVYYNTQILIGDGDYFKYGVIGTDDLISDLENWDSLYISGRLHKPTLTLQQSDNNRLRKALQSNHKSALHTALLLLKPTFSEEQLYLTIAGLSYEGDFRMLIGEDPQKVAKLVRPQIENFRQIYLPIVESDPRFKKYVTVGGGGQWKQDCHQAAVKWHLDQLPKQLRRLVAKDYMASAALGGVETQIAVEHFNTDDVMLQLAMDKRYQNVVQPSVRRLVSRSSWSQSLKGILTAGLAKSVSYSSAKLEKMFKGMKR